MKKVVFLLVILMAVTGATVFAQSAEAIFGNIPAASYTKSDDNAVWTFATTGLTIRDNSGSITIPVRDMKDIAAVTEGGAPGVTFAYDTAENKRVYRIFANPLSGAVKINITKNGVAMPEANLVKR